jgi:hypothetical protein
LFLTKDKIGLPNGEHDTTSSPRNGGLENDIVALSNTALESLDAPAHKPTILSGNGGVKHLGDNYVRGITVGAIDRGLHATARTGLLRRCKQHARCKKYYG